MKELRKMFTIDPKKYCKPQAAASNVAASDHAIDPTETAEHADQVACDDKDASFELPPQGGADTSDADGRPEV